MMNQLTMEMTTTMRVMILFMSAQVIFLIFKVLLKIIEYTLNCDHKVQMSTIIFILYTDLLILSGSIERHFRMLAEWR